MKDIKYNTDKTGYCAVYCGKIIIAKSYIDEKGYSIRILQGMNRTETMEKIKQDCPEFLKLNNIPDNYYPLLFAQ